MTMKLKYLDEMREIGNPYPNSEYIEKWKENGGKVIGWICNYVPEEIIHAAKMLPYRMTGASEEIEMEDGDAYLHIYSCSFTRSCCQLAVEGKFKFLDGFVSTAMCDGSRRLADVIDHYGFVDLIASLGVPRKFDEKSEALYRREIFQFKKRLEAYSESEISDDSIRDSIRLYNRTRQLLKELYDLRKLDAPPVSGAETLEVLNAVTRMPREKFNEILEKLLAEIKGRRVNSDWKVRLMIDGSIIQNIDFVKSIEELGGLVAMDGLCNGARYWEGEVDTGLEPIPALSRYYLNKFPCPRFYPPTVRTDKVMNLIKEFRIEGIICQIIRYCNTHTWDFPILRSEVEEIGIPTLRLDTEYGQGATGRIKTRVQAFIEMLQERKVAR